MVISHKHRFVFFSNPKTGSESIRLLLQDFQEEQVRTFRERSHVHDFYSHMRPVEARTAFRKRDLDFDDYYRFVFIRNPWARLVSLYEMIRQNKHADIERKVPWPERLANLRNGSGDPLFKRWLKTVSEGEAGGGGHDEDRWRKYGTYSLQNFVNDEHGKRLVNEVVPLERMHDRLPGLLAKLDLPLSPANLPHVNRRTSGQYAPYYDLHSRALVANRYRNEIEEFDYRFEQDRGQT
ncbi:MAG: sulfotransferase family 2 domain-containing protein [Pseudomonadota bacterium]